MSSFLIVIGISIKFMKNGRANRTWHAMIEGRSSEIVDAAERMQKCLARLALATQFVSLDSIQSIDTKVDILTDKVDEHLQLENITTAAPEILAERLRQREIKDQALVDEVCGSQKESRDAEMRMTKIRREHLILGCWERICGRVTIHAADDNQFLQVWRGVCWIHGVSGIGRTHFAWSIVEHVRRSTGLSTAIGFVKDEHGSATIKSALCFCIWKLAKQDSKYCQAVAYRLRDLPAGGSLQDLSLAELWHTYFAELFSKGSSSKALIILDDINNAATTECKDFAELLLNSVSSDLQITVSFTSSASIMKEFQALEFPEYHLDYYVMQEAVEEVLNASLEQTNTYENLAHLDETTKQEIVFQLGSRGKSSKHLSHTLLILDRYGYGYRKPQHAQ
jgi:hypothetical protein